MTAASPIQPNGSAPGPNHRRAFAWHHPVLGRFEVHLDLEGGVSARLDLEARHLILAAPNGVLLRTPWELPDLRVTRATLELKTAAMKIASEPALGPFGEELLSELARETLLAGFDAAGLLARLRGADDRVVLYEGNLVKVDACALSSLSLLVTRRQIELTLSRPIVLDFGRLLGKTEVSTLVWRFALGSLEARLTGRVNLWGRVVERVVPALARHYFRRFVPGEMLTPGFDLARDKTLLPHLAAMLRGLATPTAALQPEDRPSVAPADVPPADAPPTDAPTVADHPETVRIALDPGDALELERTPSGVRLETAHGLYLVAPGRAWTRRFRLRALRWDAATGAVTVESSPPMGEATRAGFAALVVAHAIDPVVAALAPLERDAAGRVRLPLGKRADLYLPDGTLTARLDGRSLSVTARPRGLVVAGSRFVRFALREVAYATPERAVRSDIGGASCLGRLFVRRARRVLAAELRAWLLAHLPEPMRAEGYDLFADPSQAHTLGALFAPPDAPPDAPAA